MSGGLDRLQTLVPRLQAISTANGYRTNPAAVLVGPIPLGEDATLPVLRLHWPSTDPESSMPFVPHGKLRVNFIVEAEGTAAPADLLAAFEDFSTDIKRAVFGDAMRDLEGAAIDVRFDGQQFTPPEPGANTFLVRVAGSFTYIDHFNAP